MVSALFAQGPEKGKDLPPPLDELEMPQVVQIKVEKTTSDSGSSSQTESTSYFKPGTRRMVMQQQRNRRLSRIDSMEESSGPSSPLHATRRRNSSNFDLLFSEPQKYLEWLKNNLGDVEEEHDSKRCSLESDFPEDEIVKLLENEPKTVESVLKRYSEEVSLKEKELPLPSSQRFERAVVNTKKGIKLFATDQPDETTPVPSVLKPALNEEEKKLMPSSPRRIKRSPLRPSA